LKDAVAFEYLWGERGLEEGIYFLFGLVITQVLVNDSLLGELECVLDMRFHSSSDKESEGYEGILVEKLQDGVKKNTSVMGFFACVESIDNNDSGPEMRRKATAVPYSFEWFQNE
jgi:hypothetical protein